MSERQKRVLFLRFSSLGDVIISNFSAMKLKERHPDWNITWLVDSAYAGLVRYQPWVDDVIEWDRRKDGNIGFLKVLKEVRLRRFDILLDMHHSDRSSFFSLLSGIPLRYSSRRRFPFAHNRYSFDDIWDVGQKLSSCSRYLYSPPPSDRIRSLLKRGPAGRSLVLAIGASYAIKRWPVKSWIGFCMGASRAGYFLYLVGDGRDEVKSAEDITTAVRSDRLVNLVGKLSISELVQVINETDTTISGDTGALHIARALGKSVVGLFGPNVLDHNYISSLSNVFYCKCPDLGCKNWQCDKACLETIQYSEVLDGVNEIMKRGK